MTFFDQLNLTVLDLRILILFYLKEHDVLTIDVIAERIDYTCDVRKVRSRIDVLLSKHLIARRKDASGQKYVYPHEYICGSLEMRMKVIEGFIEIREEICKWM